MFFEESKNDYKKTHKNNDRVKSKPKHPRGSKEGSSRSQEEQHVEEKVSSTENNDEFSSPTSAPPKLYSGSLFLYSNDPFGCFTNENQDTIDDKHYNKFFNYSKPAKGNSHKHTSHSQGDIDSVGAGNNNYDHLIHETKSDLDISDMLSKQNSSLADARLSPDRLDPATNKAIIDIFEDGFALNDTKTFNKECSRDDSNKNQNNAGRSKVDRENKVYNSPKRQKENRDYDHRQMIAPSMGYMQAPYMSVPNQPYNNMIPPQGFAYPLNDGGFRRMNQYPTNSYYQYDEYQNERDQTSANFGNSATNKNTVDGSSLKVKREESQKKESINIRKENSQTSQQNQRKEKKPQPENKANSDTNSLSSEQPAKASTLDSEEFENLVTNALKLAKDQSGCRMLQKEIETEDVAIIARIFDKIIQDFGQLMVDPFGNYLCQKIAEVCENSQMKQIIQVVSINLADICYNPHGTRAVQKLIEVVKDQRLIEMLVESLSRGVVGLVKDNNGNHVVQKCLTNMSDRNKQFIYDSIVENCIDIATHKHGCCVIQRCLDHASKKQKADLTRVVAENALNLVTDQYGNYVVQYVMELKDTDSKTKKRIADELSKDIVELSKQKFSSNVVEKCLQSGISTFRNYFMELMIQDEVITEMICDKFANYVLQRFLAQADDNEKTKILEVHRNAIYNNSDSIKNDLFGNKIFAKLCKTYNSLSDVDSNSNPSLSPLISETSSLNNFSNRQAHLRNETNYRMNSDNNKHIARKQHMNRNNDRRNPQNEMNRLRRQSNGNQQNNLHKGPFGHPVQGSMMYPTMGNQMLPVPSFGPTMIQTPYFVPQPQMYNQYYNYPTSQQGMFYPNIY